MDSMKLHLIFTFLSVAVLASHAALPSVVYWNSMLPQTPMPKVVKELLYNEWSEDKSTSVDVGKGGVNVNTGKGNPGNVKDGKPSTNVGVGKGGVVVRTGPKKRPVYVGVTPSKNPFVYKYAANEDQLHDKADVAVFFTEKDLNPGSTMNLHFVKSATTPAPALLPRKVSESIPFSTKYIPEIYEKFSVAPDSKEAGIIKKTITECEEPGIKGEEKYCATSLESMIDFTISKLGKHVNAISTETEKEDTHELQKYTVVGVKKVTDDDKAVVCHKINYAYAVFYCHKTETTEAFEVSLVGADGTKTKAAAVCHKDTSEWNPKHLAFQVLKVKPGTVPVCHFLPEDHIVWVAN